jgi:L-threonylcarbamoyladenylate synthase
VSSAKQEDLAWLGWSSHRINFGGSYILSESGDSQEAAHNVFSQLRLISEAGFEGIIAELPPQRGLGGAIQDRLRRGASGFALCHIGHQNREEQWFLPAG